MDGSDVDDTIMTTKAVTIVLTLTKTDKIVKIVMAVTMTMRTTAVTM